MRAPRHHPGFTLIELLLVVALLLAAGALVYPSMLERMNERAFESAGEIIVNQLLLARAYARAESEPVEVLYVPDPRSVHARRFDPTRPSDDETGSIQTFGGPTESDEPTARRADTGETSELLIPEDWAIRPLPRGMWIDARSSDDEVRLAGPGLFRALPVDHGDRPLRLAVFLPDGSALVGEAVFIGDDTGRRRRLAVNPWTGLPVLADDDNAQAQDGDDDTDDELADERDDPPDELEEFEPEVPVETPESPDPTEDGRETEAPADPDEEPEEP